MKSDPKQTIIAFVNREYADFFRPPLETQTNLDETIFNDSLNTIKFLLFLEKEFGTKFSPRLLQREHFTSVDTIVAMVVDNKDS